MIIKKENKNDLNRNKQFYSYCLEFHDLKIYSANMIEQLCPSLLYMMTNDNLKISKFSILNVININICPFPSMASQNICYKSFILQINIFTTYFQTSKSTYGYVIDQPL